MRPEIRSFAELMEAQLKANDHKPGWKNDSFKQLFDRIHEELHELREACVFGGSEEQIRKEASDVANFAMMIADVFGGLEYEHEDLHDLGRVKEA